MKHTLVACRTSGLLCETFSPKSFNAKLKAIACFMKKHNYVYHRAANTIKSQHVASEVGDEAKSFLEEIHPLLVGPHCDM